MTCILCNNFTARLQRLVGLKSSKAAAAAGEKRNSRPLQISAPFNFKHETISLPGLSEDDSPPSNLLSRRATPTPLRPQLVSQGSFVIPQPRNSHPTTAPIPPLQNSPSADTGKI
ncbi:hypothetical protein EKO27_g9689 [Xylaria grammica]|uniref:Uncharacterized protein n=1 Tax=Xylaria grammica TaxID=363999 RepID=A0A439CTC2_9PEZI|nr:hypothetical protein EKO27_g9689 [Xylaria grammica]